jgi:hypothetical protein
MIRYLLDIHSLLRSDSFTSYDPKDSVLRTFPTHIYSQRHHPSSSIPRLPPNPISTHQFQPINNHSPHFEPTNRLQLSILTMRISALISGMLGMLLLPLSAQADPIGYAICQAGCAGARFTCYSSAGFVFGRAAGATDHPAYIGCTAAFSACQAVCSTVMFCPYP